MQHKCPDNLTGQRSGQMDVQTHRRKYGKSPDSALPEVMDGARRLGLRQMEEIRTDDDEEFRRRCIDEYT